MKGILFGYSGLDIGLSGFGTFAILFCTTVGRASLLTWYLYSMDWTTGLDYTGMTFHSKIALKSIE